MLIEVFEIDTGIFQNENKFLGGNMLVKDVMTKNPITIQEKESVLEAKDLMTKNKINKLPVVDKSGSLVGIITANDLQRSTPSDATTLDMYELGYLLSKLTVEKIMTKKVITVDENETVEEAARIMADKDFGCLPVMSNNLLIGIITESDLFKMFIEMFNARTKGIRLMLNMSDNPGSLAIFTQKVAEKNGKIVSVVTSPSKNENSRKITVKVTNISFEDLKAIAEDCSTIDDIREV